MVNNPIKVTSSYLNSETFVSDKQNSDVNLDLVNKGSDLSMLSNTLCDLLNNNTMLSVFHVNIQCLSNKVDQINLFLDKFKFKAVCFSEHWQNESILKCINVLGYTLVSHFCRKSYKHGGVALYLKNNLKYKLLILDDYNCELHSEFCGIELIPNKILIITLYRSCLGDSDIFLLHLELLLNKYLVNNNKIILVGDFNVNFNAKSSFLTDLSILLNSFDLNITITSPTRISATSSSCIDNIITNLDEYNIITDVLEPCLSDHLGQYIIVKGHEMNKPRDLIQKRILSNKNINKLRNILLGVNWSIFECPSYDVNFLSIFLVNTFQNSMNIAMPLKNISNENRPPVNWFNNCLRSMRDDLSKVKLISDVSKNPNDISIYNILKKEYRLHLNNTKKNAYDNYISSSSNKSKSSWQIINYERNKNPKNNLATDLTCNKFNDFFTDIAENIIKSLPDINLDNLNYYKNFPAPISSFFLHPVTTSEVFNAINNLKHSNSIDVHELNSRILRETSDIILLPLTILINLIFSTGTFPDIFKYSKVIPIYKKGDSSCLNNYRPISIISIFAKIVEIILKQRLTNYFESNLFLTDSQFGFRKNRSTFQAVQSVVGSIVGGLERGEHTAITLCDLTKAFDCVSHDLLLEKLSYYGIRGTAYSLIKSYLTNRFQRVNYSGINSDFNMVKCGVPQGSVLGPLLFIIYINDICSFMSPNKCVLFADDTTLICANKNVTDLAQNSSEILVKASNWFSINKLKLNEDKTQEIIFSSNVNITNKKSVSLLGIVLDDRLTWATHVESLSHKLSKTIFLLRQLKTLISADILKMTYFSLFHSSIIYGVILWGNSPSSIRIFRMQKKAIRILANKNRREHCRPFFVNYGIMPLPSIFIYCVLLEIHKNINTFSVASNIHEHNTRSSNLLRNERFRLTTSQQNSLNLNLYNILPAHIKSLSFYSFKVSIKKYMLKNCFYSENEFLETTHNL